MAAETGDKDRLRDLIDFDAVKTGLKEDIKAQLVASAAKELKGNPFAVLGMAMASLAVDPMVDLIVSPSGLTSLFEEGQVKTLGKATKLPSPSSMTGTSTYQGNLIERGYDGLDHYRVRISASETPKIEPLVLTFRREGLFTWKLTRVSLPSNLLNELAKGNAPQETESAGMTREQLSPLIGIPSWQAVRSPALESRLKQLLGDRKGDFEEGLSGGNSLVEESGGYLFGSGCAAHLCGSYESAFSLEESSGQLVAILLKDGNWTGWGFTSAQTDLRGPIRKWAVESGVLEVDCTELKKMQLMRPDCQADSGQSPPDAQLGSQQPTPNTTPPVPKAPTAVAPTPSPASTATPSASQSEPSAAYRQGQADRQSWEIWFASLSGDYRAGADYWAAHRSLPHPEPCGASPPSTGADWSAGCYAAQQKLAVPDARRKSDPDYWRGWNNPPPVASSPTPSDQEKKSHAIPQLASSSSSPATPLPTIHNTPDKMCGNYESGIHKCTDAEFADLLKDLQKQWSLCPEWLRARCATNTSLNDIEGCIFRETISWLNVHSDAKAPWIDPAIFETNRSHGQAVTSTPKNEAVPEQGYNDSEGGYEPISFDDFELDGKKLAARGAKISIRGMYVMVGDVEYLTPSPLASLVIQNGGGGPPNARAEESIGLLTDAAARATREIFLKCRSNTATAVYGCAVTVLGRVTMCKKTTLVGSSEAPCLLVEDSSSTSQ